MFDPIDRNGATLDHIDLKGTDATRLIGTGTGTGPDISVTGPFLEFKTRLLETPGLFRMKFQHFQTF